jgi:hypothetical protein
MSPTTQTLSALSDPDAEAAIDAASRILQLPTIRAEAISMAQTAVKQLLTHKGVPRRRADR